ncbi:MAG: hypothetical protein NWE93_00965 [Candidatus Bathyarchaeota archaeon]|nr:hypothetical protein [Candidatus Bathyarchaeota archaeon]
MKILIKHEIVATLQWDAMSTKTKLRCKACGRPITQQVHDNCDGMCLECWDDEG